MLPVRRLLLLPLLLVLSLTACAERQKDASAESANTDGFPVELRPEGAPAITLEERPERIVSLSPATTETLYAVGAGDQVVAVDEMSTVPEEAPRTQMSGLNPDPEQLASYDPDLVIVDSDTDGKLTEALDKAGIQTLVLPAPQTLESMYAQFELIGEATGHAEEGADLARRTREEIDKLVADVGDAGEGLDYYHELDPSYYTVTSATFIGQVYDLFGLTNIADQAPDTAGGYPQLSAEFVVEQDPDLIFVSYPGGVEDVRGRPAFDSVTAVREQNVVEVDADTSSRWGPRVADFAEDVAEAIEAARAE